MDYVLLALLAIPMGCTLIFILIPSHYPQLVKYVALAGAIAMFVLSAVAFFSYEFNGANGIDYELQFALLVVRREEISNRDGRETTLWADCQVLHRHVFGRLLNAAQ